MSKEVKITASGVEFGEHFRLERLQRINHMAAIVRTGGQLETDISKLHDHKGELRVTWASEPTDHEKDVIKRLWDLENEYEISHEVN